MATPMTVGILGSGEVATKAALALLEDLTEVADPVSFVFAADVANWTSVAQDIAEFIADNDVPFTLVVDDESDPGDDFKEAAQTVIKVARPGIGVVRQLERAEGDKRLVVLLDEGEDTLKAVERAIDKGIPALDLTAGLEPLVFGDDDEQPANAPDDEADAPAVLEEPTEPPKRKRRTKAEMEAARAAEAAAAAAAPTEEPAEDEDEGDEQGGGDEPQAQLRTAVAAAQEEIASEVLAMVEQGATVNDEWANRSATEFALAQAVILAGSQQFEDYTEVVKAAYAFKAFLQGTQVQTTPGRPRADGSPAQPRERDDEGKPVRRRRTASSED